MEVILETNNITKLYEIKKQHLFKKQQIIKAVKGISFQVRRGQTLGIVGESGSGKSTLAEIVGDLQQPTKGTVHYFGKNVRKLSKAEYKRFRRKVQFIFQSPKDSLHPFYTIQENLLEPLRIDKRNFNKKTAQEEINHMLTKVKLAKSILKKHPSEISGGQAQRVAIARALLLKPEVIICDECISALDLSVQEEIIQLLKELQAEFGTSYIFISHDIGAVYRMANEVMVMNQGVVVEEGNAEKVLLKPQHIYTKVLIDSTFTIDEDGVN